MTSIGSANMFVRFSEQLSSFLESSSRHVDGASEEYSEYVLERLEISVVGLTRMQQILAQAVSTESEDFTAGERVVLSEYLDIVTELSAVLRSLTQQWDERIDHFHSSLSSAFG